MPRLALLILVPAILVVAAVPVLGAAPGLKTGETVAWVGAAPGLGVIGENDQLLARYGEAPGCNPVTCSPQEVRVAEPGALSVTARDGFGGIEVDVFRPDGKFVAAVGAPGTATTVRLPTATAGTYLVQITTNQSIHRGGEFRASALLR